MEIKQIIETDEGDVEFHGVLSGIELQAVITVGLNSLVQAGAPPIIATDEYAIIRKALDENEQRKTKGTVVTATGSEEDLSPFQTINS